MSAFEELQKLIVSEIQKININFEPKGLYEPVRYTLDRGGKRVRPVLCLAAAEMFGANAKDALPAALALEVFHNFTLLHDDVMDNSPVRRGAPTVHEKWGINTAILSGDAMLVKAYQFLVQSPADKLKPLLDLFNQTAAEVCEGQQYDMEFEDRQDVSVEEYMEMIRLKTSVLLAASLKSGALVGGADNYQAGMLYEIGLSLGLAFQLQDDLLDVYGKTEKFGKRIGGDILEYKKTFLLLSAFQEAGKSQKVKLHALLSDKDTDDTKKITAVTKIYNQLNIKEKTEKKINFYYKRADDLLKDLDLPEEKKTVLKLFAENLLKRKH